MGFYEDRILPHLINLAMRNRNLVRYRQRVISAAEGPGDGDWHRFRPQFAFFPPQVHEIQGLEPSPRLIAMSRHAAQISSLPITFIEGSAEVIPLDTKSVDTVVTTWTLCTIPAAVQALEEMRRVLKPGAGSFCSSNMACHPKKACAGGRTG